MIQYDAIMTKKIAVVSDKAREGAGKKYIRSHYSGAVTGCSGCLY